MIQPTKARPVTADTPVAKILDAQGRPSTINTNSPVLTNSVSAGSLTLSWPADHTGWMLQVQTNSLGKGLGTNWVDVPGSTSTNTVSLPIVTANGTVFYRLKY